jgi:flagellar motor switch protein FliG
VTETASNKPAELSDTEKAAVVLLSIGQDAAAQVIKHMSQSEINVLSVAMARISGVPRNAVANVFQEFVDLMLQETALGIGAEEYVHGVLEKALGAEKAKRLVGRLKEGEYFAGIDAVQSQDPRVLAELIKAEHPQVIAMIFAYLEPPQLDALIKHLPIELVEQVIPRLATLDAIPPTAIRELNEAIEDLLAGAVEQEQERVAVGGAGVAAKILNRLEGDLAENILGHIGTVDPTLAERIANSMFVFEDLMQVDDKSFQVLLRAVDQSVLVAALKGADAAMQDKVLRNLSQRAAEMLREEISTRGPMRLTEVEAAKRAIIEAAQNLERENKIMLRRGRDDLVA